MSTFYANITLAGPTQDEVATLLKAWGVVSYVAPPMKGNVVVFHEDLASQESLAMKLSTEFACPALLAMGYGQAVLLYHLYECGKAADAYVSSPHDGLELDGPAPEGNAATLCNAFGRDRMIQRVGAILNKPTRPDHAYAYAANRHGDLLTALALPAFAAGGSFQLIELGELPLASDAKDPLRRT